MQTAVKRRITKFVSSKESASISKCSAQESICGILSDYDEESKTRFFAFEFCEYSNAGCDESNTREETKTISLSKLQQVMRSSSVSQCVKSVEIQSM